MKTPYFRKIFLPALLLTFVFVSNSCKKSSSTTTSDTGIVSTVTTAALIINLTSTTAQSGGTITDFGGSAITANGVCYSSTNKTPTVNDSKTSEIISTSGSLPINL